MHGRFDDAQLARLRAASPQHGDLVDCAYLGRSIGFDASLALHGGGNVSLKQDLVDLTGARVEVLFMKSTGRPLAAMEVEDLCALRLAPLRALRDAQANDAVVAREILSHRLDPDGPIPSIETLMHALLPPRFLAHTHPEPVLALGNRPEGLAQLRAAAGDDVQVVPYAKPGLALARAASSSFADHPHAMGLVLHRHGLVTWGETAREAHDRMFEVLGRIERALAALPKAPLLAARDTSPAQARARYLHAAPALRRALAWATGDDDRRWRCPILRPLQDEPTLTLLEATGARDLLDTPPPTSDQILRVGPWPVWIDVPPDAVDLADRLAAILDADTQRYEAYRQRHAGRAVGPSPEVSTRPRVVAWPGVGMVCAAGDVNEADIARDITAQALRVKRLAAQTGGYQAHEESHVFDMEFCPVQRQKRPVPAALALRGRVALVTGAAGAIGAAIVDALLAEGAHVVVTDLAGKIDAEARQRAPAGPSVLCVAMDVSEAASVTQAFDAATAAFGGVDLVVLNAGLADVSSLAQMELADFRRLERVNVEGTLLVLAEAARRFATQQVGGDVVVVSTKNVFAPGAQFGAYSASKAAAHQLARVASLELAPLDVRVNLVAPDAVFSHGERRSGLWEEVGPSRMRARGLSASQLADYYRQRNLLKVQVRAAHVAKAVLFFATRQTPTTGATLPVDGGLPDATPR